MARKSMPISSLWFQGAIFTYLFGFTVLGVLAYLVYRDQPQILGRVVVSFWSLNIGLAWMAFANLFPLGIVQLHYAVGTG